MQGYLSFSRNIFIPATNLCRNSCDYCGFSRGEKWILDLDSISKLISRADIETEALITLGEMPEVHPQFTKFLDSHGFRDTIDYLIQICDLCIQHGLLPHLNLGVADQSKLARLKPYVASMGLMLESSSKLEVHSKSPGKDPELRLATIEAAGKLRIPFTTGILVGIGESQQDWLNSARTIAELHSKYGHIQEFIVQNFQPKPGTPMQNSPGPGVNMMEAAVKTVSRILNPAGIPIQVPPNLALNWLRRLIHAGARDLGGISEKTKDYINPEAPWPSLNELIRAVYPFRLRERLPIYPRYVNLKWYSSKIAPLIKLYASQDGYRS